MSPTLGATLRRGRESARMSLSELAATTGLTKGYLSRLEHDVANPTWSTLTRVVAALDLEPALLLVPSSTTFWRVTRRLESLPIASRLSAQPVDVYGVLQAFESAFESAVESIVPSYAVTGAAAGLLHGLPVEVDRLHVLVSDDDEQLTAFGWLLKSESRLSGEVDLPFLRELNSRQWVMGGPGFLDDGAMSAEVRVDYVDVLPPTARVAVDDELTVTVESMATLGANPEVRSILTTLAAGGGGAGTGVA